MKFKEKRDGYKGTWMNKVGEQTWVCGIKQNLVEKNLIGIRNFLYCCDM